MKIYSRVTVSSEGLVAEDVSGVASFSENTLVLRSGGGAISISGEKLIIVSMDDSRTVVSGIIKAISFL